MRRRHSDPQPEAGLPDGYVPPSASLTPPGSTREPGDLAREALGSAYDRLPPGTTPEEADYLTGCYQAISEPDADIRDGIGAGLVADAKDVEITRLRQALWDVFAACGGDTDGDKTPAALSSEHLISSALEITRELRQDYDETLQAPDPMLTVLWEGAAYERRLAKKARAQAVILRDAARSAAAIASRRKWDKAEDAAGAREALHEIGLLLSDALLAASRAAGEAQNMPQIASGSPEAGDQGAARVHARTDSSQELPGPQNASDIRPRPGEPGWYAVTCGACGEEWGTNFRIEEIECPECEARRCPCCKTWFGGES